MKVKEKVGDFALDIAKLIFGGVILSSIMSESINSVVVYSLGLFFFIFTTALDFVLIDNTGKKGGNI